MIRGMCHKRGRYKGDKVLVVLSQRMGWRYIGVKKYSFRVVINADLVGDGDAGGEFTNYYLCQG
jgi:hypothetical protein